MRKLQQGRSLDLGDKLILLHHRAHNQLGEKADKQRIVQEGDVFTLTPVVGDGIHQDLEGKEGDADGEDGGEEGDACPKNEVNVFHEEVGIFKVYQQPDVPHHRRQQQRPPVQQPIRPVQGPDDQIVEKDGSGKHKDEFRLSQPIENQRGQHQPALHGGYHFLLPQQVVYHQHHRQEHKNKTVGGKDHRYMSILSIYNFSGYGMMKPQRGRNDAGVLV